MVMGCASSLILSAIFPLSYVGLIYLFDSDGTNRDDPKSVRKRTMAALVNNVSSLFVAYMFLSWNEMADPLAFMGLRMSGTVAAVVIPTVLMSVLYCGQFLMMFYDGSLQGYFSIRTWKTLFSDESWVRDTIVAPLTEEIAFRVCSAAVMSHCLSNTATVLISPLFFSLSHFHHIGDDQHRGFSLGQAVMRRSFQCAYTYVFGVYACYMFLNTRHFLAPIVTHSICNMLGLPLIHEIGTFGDRWKRISLWTAYGAGLAGFAILLPQLTAPALYL